MASIDYIIAGTPPRITCGQCGLTSLSAEDVYFRWCPNCGVMLGPEIRQKWNAHRNALQGVCEKFGQYKKVIVMGTGTAHRVPTELILTEGVKGANLSAFPLWDKD